MTRKRSIKISIKLQNISLILKNSICRRIFQKQYKKDIDRDSDFLKKKNHFE